jgi:hypothetical protein
MTKKSDDTRSPNSRPIAVPPIRQGRARIRSSRPTRRGGSRTTASTAARRSSEACALGQGVRGRARRPVNVHVRAGCALRPA